MREFLALAEFHLKACFERRQVTREMSDSPSKRGCVQ